MNDAISLGPPECIFEGESRAAAADFLRSLPGQTPELALNELKRQR